MIAARANGRPLATWGTWPAWLPAFLRFPIDQVIAGPGIACAVKSIGPALTSDHRPIIVDFRAGRERELAYIPRFRGGTERFSMTRFSDYGRYDALGLAELVAKRDVKPEELLEEAIARADTVNPQLNALTQRHDELARASLRNGLADAPPNAPFRGVPLLLKDLSLFLNGTATMNGSRLFETKIADHDSTLTVRVKAAGSSCSARPTRRSSAWTATTEPKFGGAHAQSVAHGLFAPAARPAARRRRSLQASCRSPRRATAADRSADRPPPAAFSASSRRAGASPWAPTAAKAGRLLDARLRQPDRPR